jgi:hypothetical protein
VYKYITLIGEPQGKRLCEIPRCKQQDTIKMGLNIIDDKGCPLVKTDLRLLYNSDTLKNSNKLCSFIRAGNVMMGERTVQI